MTTIQDFWFEHERFWFPVTAGEKLEADFEISKLFWNYDLSGENLIGQIIYYDQFSRHFQRAGLLVESDVAAWRQKALMIARDNLDHLLSSEDERVLVWSLMPYKHAGFCVGAVEKATPFLRENRPLLRRFYEDTYKKGYTEDEVWKGLILSSKASVKYDVAAITEESGVDLIHPYRQTESHTLPLADVIEEAGEDNVVVSLSGGVDSMLLCYLYRAMRYSVSAIHIIYGNRAESEEEYSFIADFCERIGVPLVTYRIPWLRRDRGGGNVSREFYERMTRDLRFMVYRLVAGNRPVVLGHIHDDLVENIMTNFVRGDHLGWLGAMTLGDTQMGVKLLRPFLHVKKEDIYAAARVVGLGWLKNTTPSWSNRGKFREKFYGALVEQYGASVDDSLVAVAEKISTQSAMLDRLLYQPVFASWRAEEMSLDVTAGMEAQLNAAGWSRIFEWVCHDRLGVRKPTLGAASEFIRRVGRLVGDGRIKINMGKNLVFLVKRHEGRFKMVVELS